MKERTKYTRVKDYVNNRVCYPECKGIEKVNGIVLVEYSVMNNGKLNVTGINSSNQLLQEYVLDQFSKIEIKDTSFAEDTSFICKYIFVDEENLNNPDIFKVDENVQPQFDYLAENID